MNATKLADKLAAENSTINSSNNTQQSRKGLNK